MKRSKKNIIAVVIIAIIYLMISLFMNTRNIEKGDKKTESEQTNRSLSYTEFDKKSKEEKTIVIDIRTAKEVSSVKLYSDAKEIDFYMDNFEEKISKLDPNMTYLVYCRSGNRSGKALGIFQKYNLKTYDLEGGISSVLY